MILGYSIFEIGPRFLCLLVSYIYFFTIFRLHIFIKLQLIKGMLKRCTIWDFFVLMVVGLRIHYFTFTIHYFTTSGKKFFWWSLSSFFKEFKVRKQSSGFDCSILQSLEPNISKLFFFCDEHLLKSVYPRISCFFLKG